MIIQLFRENNLSIFAQKRDEIEMMIISLRNSICYDKLNAIVSGYLKGWKKLIGRTEKITVHDTKRGES